MRRKAAGQKAGNLGLMKSFLPYFKKYWVVLVLDLLCAAFTTVCELVFPLIVRFITDLGMNDLERLTVQLVLSVGVFLPGSAGYRHHGQLFYGLYRTYYGGEDRD